MKNKLLNSFRVFLIAYISTILTITFYNNTILLWKFCGSLSDFHEGPVPSICLGFWDYLFRALLHLPYVLAAVVAGLFAAILYIVIEYKFEEVTSSLP